MSSTASLTNHIWRPSHARTIAVDGFVPVPRGTLPTAAATLSWPAKDPGDVLDYQFDVSAALGANTGDSIATVDVAITPAGTGDLAVDSVAADGALAVLWLSGGHAGTIYTVRISVTTQTGRTISRAVLLPVRALASAAVPATSLTTGEGAIITDELGNPILLGS